MATERQIAANKLNSQKSTGPKSEQGKAKSSLNRFSHGFESNTTLAPDEDPKELSLLLADLTCEHQPMTPTEQLLVEKMVHTHWLSLRAFRLQGEAFLDQTLMGDTFGIPKTLGLLIRYHAAAERAFHRAHTELVKTQKERKKSEIGFEPQNASQPPEPVAPEPIKSSDLFPRTPLEYKINPDFTYLTPAKAAAAAIFKKAA
jgi:hypothetical protein